jgi:hypothetical protein
MEVLLNFETCLSVTDEIRNGRVLREKMIAAATRRLVMPPTLHRHPETQKGGKRADPAVSSHRGCRASTIMADCSAVQ